MVFVLSVVQVWPSTLVYFCKLNTDGKSACDNGQITALHSVLCNGEVNGCC